MSRFSTFDFVAAFAVSLSFGPIAHAQAVVYTDAGADSLFSNAANWDADPAGQNVIIDGPFVVERSADITVLRTFVRGGAVLNITGGVQSDYLGGASTSNTVGTASKGTVNLSGGSYDIGHGLRVGNGNADADGTFSVTGGSLNVSGNSVSNIGSSSFRGRASLQIGSQTAGGSGVFEVSGGSVSTHSEVHVGATGVFSVVGSGAASISVGNLGSFGQGGWIQRTGGTLSAAIDVGGLTPIFIDDIDDDGLVSVFAEFESGSLLDLSFDGIDAFAGTWTILELENGDIETAGTGTVTGLNLGLGLSTDTDVFDGVSGWSFAIDNTGANGLLTATYTAIPEPTSFAVLAAGGLLALGRRRQ